MANAYRDQNNIPTLIAASNVDGQTPVRLWADPVTHRLLVDSNGGGGGSTTFYTETPSGVINGSNTVYTTVNAIGTIVTFDINNGFIHPFYYSYTGNTITFTTPIDASLAGEPFTIVYTSTGSTPPSGGGINRSVNSISTNTTAGATASTDYVYLSSGTINLTLPTAVSNTNLYNIKNTSTGIISVITTSSQTIDGVTTQTLAANESLQVISNNSNWFII